MHKTVKAAEHISKEDPKKSSKDKPTI